MQLFSSFLSVVTYCPVGYSPHCRSPRSCAKLLALYACGEIPTRFNQHRASYHYVLVRMDTIAGLPRHNPAVFKFVTCYLQVHLRRKCWPRSRFWHCSLHCVRRRRRQNVGETHLAVVPMKLPFQVHFHDNHFL